jgi:sodium-independent sulfate anion transporter 11
MFLFIIYVFIYVIGFLVEFVSTPVVSGFTSAAAIMIASAQVKGLLGLRFDAESFTETWGGVFSHISEVRVGDAVLALCCCTVLLTMKVCYIYNLLLVQ